MSDVTERVKRRYAAAAQAAAGAPSCCSPQTASGGCCGEEHATCGTELYPRRDLETLPREAALASLGCGNPLAVAELKEGETVLDLGSGAGIDVLLSARRVGPRGKVYGLDMTEEMLALARANQAKAGADNVEFLEGYIEAIPLPAAVIDVVISNCVINLAANKDEVFAEMQRVLRPGGRIGITDVVASDELTPEERAQRGSYAGCIAGALSISEYREALLRAGFARVEVAPTHAVADGMFSAIVRAVKATAPVAPVARKDTSR